MSTAPITLHSLSPAALNGLIQLTSVRVLDVRGMGARKQSAADIPSATWHDPAMWLDWKDGIPKDKPLVVYCAKGHEISQGLCAALQAMGAQVSFLDGGFAAWQAAGLATQPQ